MNKKQKDYDKREAPAWLVNLIIRLRVARWRLVERLNRWAAGRKRSHLIASFVVVVMVGAALYLNILVWVLRPRHAAQMKKWDSIYRHDAPIWDRHERWQNLSDNPRLQHDEKFYWHLLDSLMADSSLRHSIDSLLNARPGLADTLRQVGQIHPRQTK